MEETEAALERKLNAITASFDDLKARDIAVFRFSNPNAIADAFVIASATSGRHAQGAADAVLEALKKSGHEFLRMEGYDNAQWILLDCNDVIVHIFQEEARQLYRLDDLCSHES